MKKNILLSLLAFTVFFTVGIIVNSLKSTENTQKNYVIKDIAYSGGVIKDVIVQGDEEHDQFRSEKLGEVYLAYNTESLPDVRNIEKTAEGEILTLNGERIGGEIYFSGIKKGEKDVASYKMKVNIDGTLSSYEKFTEEMQISFANNDKGAYFSIGKDLSQKDLWGVKYTQANTEDDNVRYIGTGVWEREITQSPEGDLVAFQRQISSGTVSDNIVLVKNNEIVVYSLSDDKEQLIIEGAVRPHWIKSGTEITYLKEDGFYSKNISSGEETLILPAWPGSFIATSNYDISESGYVVFTTAKTGVIYTLKLDFSAKDFNPKLANRLYPEDVEFYWPVLSPGGDYYVVQTIDKKTDELYNRLNPRMEVRSLATNEIIDSMALEEFNFDAFFTDDWIK